MSFIKWFRNLLKLKSPCCKTPMSSCFNPLEDTMIYTCETCKEDYI